MTQYSLQPTEIGKWKYQKRYHFLKCDLLSRHRIENIEKKSLYSCDQNAFVA